MKPITFCVLKNIFAVCRFNGDSPIPHWFQNNGFYTVTKTDDELSIVCEQQAVPEGVKCEKNWRILKIDGVLDFSLVGILASVSTILANEKISIFVISTYDTDYILVKENDFESAVAALKSAGHIVNIE